MDSKDKGLVESRNLAIVEFVYWKIKRVVDRSWIIRFGTVGFLIVSKATIFTLCRSNNFQDSLLKSIILCSPIDWVKRYNLGAVETSCHLEQASQFTTPNDQSRPSLNTKHSATMKTGKGRKKGHTEKILSLVHQLGKDW